MVLDKIGDKFEYKGIIYTVGAYVVTTSESDYAGLSGRITEIRDGDDKETENETPDIVCSLVVPNSQMEAELEDRFSKLCGCPKHVEDIPLDSVIMAPDIIVITTADDDTSGSAWSYAMGQKIGRRVIVPEDTKFVNDEEDGNEQFTSNLRDAVTELKVKASESYEDPVITGEVLEQNWQSFTKEELSACGFVEYMSDAEIDEKITSLNTVLKVLKDDGKYDAAVGKIFADEIHELESIRGLMLAPEWMRSVIREGTDVVGTDGSHKPFSQNKVTTKDGHLSIGFIAAEV